MEEIKKDGGERERREITREREKPADWSEDGKWNRKKRGRMCNTTDSSFKTYNLNDIHLSLKP